MERFKNKILFLDTAPLIYFIEAKEPYFSKILPLFAANDRGTFQFISSTLTLEEVLVAPFRENKTQLITKYETALTQSPNIKLYDIDQQVAKKAAQLRASYQVKTPDALQLATAIVYQADFFISNDKQLKKVVEVPVLILEDL